MADETTGTGRDVDPEGNRVSDRTGRGFVRGIDDLGKFALREVEYAIIDGQAVFEGCIVLGSVEDMDALAQTVADAGGPQVFADTEAFGSFRKLRRFLWPLGIVPFTIDPGLPEQKRVTDAMEHWQQNTSIQFVKRTNQRDFVTFRRASGVCGSLCGRMGGQQFVEVGDTCNKGSLMHEIGHLLGMWHEQSRTDRDQFVEVHIENVDPDARHNFDQHIIDGTDAFAYNFESVMHYHEKAFSINGKKTIFARNGAKIGQREKLSAGDIKVIQTAYADEFGKRT